MEGGRARSEGRVGGVDVGVLGFGSRLYIYAAGLCICSVCYAQIESDGRMGRMSLFSILRVSSQPDLGRAR
jgi:hypothetical protein